MSTTQAFNVISGAHDQLAIQFVENYELRTMYKGDLERAVRLMKKDQPYADMLDALTKAQQDAPVLENV